MSHRTLVSYVLVCTIALAAYAVAAGTNEYKIVRSSTGSGGVISSSGGDYQMSSTIGLSQSHVLAGDEYSVDSGFWYRIASGDCAGDGYVDLADHTRFFDCAEGPESTSDLVQCRCYDTDQDGSIDLRDFARVQTTFTGP